MDEMNLLTSMRDEVPLASPSPAAERLFHAGLAENVRPGLVPLARLRPRLLPGAAGTRGQLRSRRLAVTGVLAFGLTAAIVASFLSQGGDMPTGRATGNPSSNGTTMSAQLLADIAGKAVLSRPPVKPGQWVYQKIETYTELPPGAPSYVKPPGEPVSIQTQWVMADGADLQWGPVDGHMIGGLVLTGPNAKVNEQDEQILANAARAYSQLSTLPKDPAALYAYLAPKDARPVSPQVRPYKPGATPQPAEAFKGAGSKPTPADSAESVFTTIENMLSSEILPPTLTAELYHTLADIPGIIAKKNVKDFTGQSAVEFILPQSAYSVNLGIFLSPTTYQYLGQASWPSPPYHWQKNGSGWSGSGMFNETVLLAQAPVSAPGELP